MSVGNRTVVTDLEGAVLKGVETVVGNLEVEAVVLVDPYSYFVD